MTSGRLRAAAPGKSEVVLGPPATAMTTTKSGVWTMVEDSKADDDNDNIRELTMVRQLALHEDKH